MHKHPTDVMHVMLRPGVCVCNTLYLKCLKKILSLRAAASKSLTKWGSKTAAWSQTELWG